MTQKIQRKILQWLMLTNSLLSLVYSAYFTALIGSVFFANFLFLGMGINFWFRNSKIKPFYLDLASLLSAYSSYFWVQCLFGNESGIHLSSIPIFSISLMMFFPRHKYIIFGSFALALFVFLTPLIPYMNTFYPEYRDLLNNLPNVRFKMEIAVFMVIILNSFLYAIFWASRILNLSAEKSEKEKYLRVLTHDLKEPLIQSLTAIRNLKEKPQISEIEIQALETAQICMKEIINNVENLEGSKLNLQFTQSEVLLADCLNKILPWLKSRLQEKRISIDTSAIDESHSFIGHSESITYQILLNILTNAVKFSNLESTIKISTNRDEKGVSWFISDSGVGVSDEELAQTQTPGVGTLGERGTGLGIFIIRQFAKKNGLEVSWIKTQGTTVVLRQIQV